MANAGVFEAGYAQGAQQGGESRLLKQQRQEQEFLQKNDDLIKKRNDLQAKLGTLKDANGNPMPGYDETLNSLTDTVKEIGEHWHPEKNPGMIQKFGHVLTDALHITKPQQRVEKTAEERANRIASAQEQAQGLAVAAPLSPAQVSAQQTQAEIEAKQAANDATIEWAKKQGIVGSELDEIRRHLAGLNVSKLVPLGKPYKGPDGKYYQPLRDPDTNEITGQPMPPDYVLPVAGAPVRAWGRDATGKIYSVLLDRSTNQPIAGSENYDLLPPPYLTTRISTGMYHWVDEDNQVHETPETRTTSPSLPPATGAGKQPASPPESKATPATNSGTGGSPRKEQIRDRILGYKSSAPLNHARQVLSDSVRIESLADKLQKKAESDPEDMSEADAQFVLTLIRSEAGRVNQQEIAQIFQAGGIAEMPERWAAKAGHGQLSDNLRNQLVDFTHDMKDASQDAVNSLTHDPAQMLNEANRKLFPNAPDVGTTEVDEKNQSRKYKGGDPGDEKNWPVVNQ